MASRDLPAGRVVQLSDVALVSMTREQMKDRGIKGMFMSDPKQVIGAMVKTEIKSGDTFNTSQFFADGYRPNVADRLKPGQRAITIQVDSEDALSGYANAGQHVDLIFRVGDALAPLNGGTAAKKLQTWDPEMGYHGKATGGGGFAYTYDDRVQRRSGGANRAGGSPYAKATVTLIQDVEILALENSAVTENARDLPANETVRVTIAVSPDQAETIRAVEGRGGFSLSLRNPADKDIVENIAAKSLEDILGIKEQPEPPAPPKVPAPRPRTIDRMEVYRGSSVKRLTFDGSHPLAVRIDPTAFAIKQPVASPEETEAIQDTEEPSIFDLLDDEQPDFDSLGAVSIPPPPVSKSLPDTLNASTAPENQQY